MGVLRARNFKKRREMRGSEFILGARGYAGRGRISRETEKRKEERITLGMEREIVGILCHVSGKLRPPNKTCSCKVIRPCLPTAQSAATAKLLKLTRDFLPVFPYHSLLPKRLAIQFPVFLPNARLSAAPPFLWRKGRQFLLCKQKIIKKLIIL